MTGSLVRTTVISGMVACGVVPAGGAQVSAPASPWRSRAPTARPDTVPTPVRRFATLRRRIGPRCPGRPARQGSGGGFRRGHPGRGRRPPAAPRRGSNPEPPDGADDGPGADESDGPADPANPDPSISAHDGRRPIRQRWIRPCRPVGRTTVSTTATTTRTTAAGRPTTSGPGCSICSPRHPRAPTQPRVWAEARRRPALPSVQLPSSPSGRSPARLPPDEELPERAGGPAGSQAGAEPPAAVRSHRPPAPIPAGRAARRRHPGARRSSAAAIGRPGDSRAGDAELHRDAAPAEAARGSRDVSRRARRRPGRLPRRLRDVPAVGVDRRGGGPGGAGCQWSGRPDGARRADRSSGRPRSALRSGPPVRHSS